jgi:hypothetical protein
MLRLLAGVNGVAVAGLCLMSTTGVSMSASSCAMPATCDAVNGSAILQPQSTLMNRKWWSRATSRAHQLRQQLRFVWMLRQRAGRALAAGHWRRTEPHAGVLT